MKRVYILRHAKSSWAQPGIGDHERPLNGRGRSVLPLMAAAMADRNYQPDTVFCSTAVRTKSTLSGICQEFPAAPISYEQSLYAAPAETFLNCIQGCGDVQSMLIVAHNPACDDFIRMMCQNDGAAMGKYLQKHFPTGALAIIDIAAQQWSAINWGAGDLIDFITPRELGLQSTPSS